MSDRRRDRELVRATSVDYCGLLSIQWPLGSSKGCDGRKLAGFGKPTVRSSQHRGLELGEGHHLTIVTSDCNGQQLVVNNGRGRNEGP